jgi:hypothetical protein
LPRKRTPPIFPFRTRARKAGVGGEVSVPTTVSAVLDRRPVNRWARVVERILVVAPRAQPASVIAATTATAAAARTRIVAGW